ncbi:gliding motility lipoprotein GldB [Psychroserpens sp. Hel_I_66]|uniref:gliding motility lipoprotein GldB n=1 Tax=Psychroserpens sp. Hel_I_66 TaxID=1250004 RepID=UPI0006484888|nr:gliding motility lipoprotein GldB [Psychroserpens sp. Hel_I_66]
MKKIALNFLILLSIFSCKNEDALETEIAKIQTDIQIERFDRAFAEAKPSDLNNLQTTFPFLFSSRVPDSLWVERMTDSFQIALNNETDKQFGDFQIIAEDIERLFQHLKYYDKTFSEPRVITLTNFVQYRDKVAVTDSIVLIAIDNYLGEKHEFYGGFPKYIAENLKPSQIVVDLAKAYAEKQIFQSPKKTFLDEMIFFGKQLYFKDKMIPFKTDAEKIGYKPEQLEFAKENEDMIWTEFVENEMLYSTDSAFPARFIADAPFSKFYLELDNQTPGRLGQYMGWQIVRSYMKGNDVSLEQMLQTDAIEIFNKSNYKPPK